MSDLLPMNSGGWIELNINVERTSWGSWLEWAWRLESETGGKWTSIDWRADGLDGIRLYGEERTADELRSIGLTCISTWSGRAGGVGCSRWDKSERHASVNAQV